MRKAAKNVNEKPEKKVEAVNTNAIAIWKTVVQTQMHFNEMLQKVRFVGLTIFIGVMGAAAETLRIKPPIRVKLLYDVHVAFIIQFFALLLWGALICLEYYFFGLLLGSVAYGKQIEKKCEMLEGGLTNKITSTVSTRKAERLLFIFYAVPFLGGMLFLVALYFSAPQAASG